MEAEVEARVEEETKVATGAGAGSMPAIWLGLLLLEMALIVLVGLVAFVHLGDFLRNTVNSELVVREGGDLFPIWAEPPIQPLLKVYMFNVTNADAWLAGEGGVKLEVEEVGPLVYRETWWRTNVELHPDGQVSYDLVKRFVPVPELSAVKEDLLITIPNIPYWAGADRMAGQNHVTQWAFQSAASNLESQLFIQRSVSELLWGYEEPLLVGATMVLPPGEVRLEGHFGLLAGRNMSSEGRYTIWGGGGPRGLDQLGEVTAWDGETKSHAWKGSCAHIGGGEGSQFPPGLTKGNLSLWVPALCRPLELVSVREEELEGVPVIRYEPHPQVFSYSSPGHSCYCLPPADCSGYGVFYVAPCKFGAPLVVSWPHLLGSSLQNSSVQGLSPNIEKHGLHMLIQPTMGMGLSAAIRLQLNLDMRRLPGLAPFSELPEDRLLLPVMWFENTISTPPASLIVILKDALASPDSMARSCLTACLGVVLLQGCLLLFYASCRGGTAFLVSSQDPVLN